MIFLYENLVENDLIEYCFSSKLILERKNQQYCFGKMSENDNWQIYVKKLTFLNAPDLRFPHLELGFDLFALLDG